MKVIIAGGRDFVPDRDDTIALNQLHRKYNFTEVVSGEAEGADAFGASWAENADIPVKRFPVVWGGFLGARAGMRRNQRMIDYILPHRGMVVVFPGGRGTKDCIMRAMEAQLPIVRARG